MEIKFENGSKMVIDNPVNIKESIRGTTVFFEKSITCPDCENLLEIKKGFSNHTAAVICENCQQSWHGLIENLEKLFNSKIV